MTQKGSKAKKTVVEELEVPVIPSNSALQGCPPSLPRVADNRRNEIMKKIIRTTIGILLIVFGLAVVVLSLWLFPHPFELGNFFFSFLPPVLIGATFVFIGHGVLTDMTWRDALDLIFMSWR